MMIGSGIKVITRTVCKAIVLVLLIVRSSDGLSGHDMGTKSHEIGRGIQGINNFRGYSVAITEKGIDVCR
jgi:hypothetical protein